MERRSETDGQTWGKIKPSGAAMRITNPIRDIVDKLKLPDNPTKAPLSLSIGTAENELVSRYSFSFLESPFCDRFIFNISKFESG
jgi:hypothetical protein